MPLWGIAVYFVYAMRRVECPACGVKVEQVPWCDGKNQLTTTYRWFLAGWAKRLSWKGVACAFGTTWQNVFRSVKHAVSWGLAHRSLEGIEAIGVDEIQWQRGHKYLTLVYQIDEDCRRLLWAGKDRTAKTLLRFFRMLGKERSAQLRFVCSDMWKPYLKVIGKKASQAIHVLDRFHIMAKMNKAIDEVRAAEAKRLERDGYEPVLKHSRWCLLKRKENLTEKQAVKLSELLQYNLQSVRSRLMREDFQRFWEYCLPGLCGEVSGRVVYADDAFEDRADEESRQDLAPPPGLDSQLVPCGRRHFGGDCRGSEQQSKTDHEKSVRLSDCESHRNRPISPTWRPAPSQNSPTNSGEENGSSRVAVSESRRKPDLISRTRRISTVKETGLPTSSRPRRLQWRGRLNSRPIKHARTTNSNRMPKPHIAIACLTAALLTLSCRGQ